MPAELVPERLPGVQVFKFDPSTDAASYYVSGEIEYVANMTGLAALIRFDEQVAHVNFDHSCRARACGRCAMAVNGEPALICPHFLEEGEHAFEPLPVDHLGAWALLRAAAEERRLVPSCAKIVEQPAAVPSGAAMGGAGGVAGLGLEAPAPSVWIAIFHMRFCFKGSERACTSPVCACSGAAPRGSELLTWADCRGRRLSLAEAELIATTMLPAAQE